MIILKSFESDLDLSAFIQKNFIELNHSFFTELGRLKAMREILKSEGWHEESINIIFNDFGERIKDQFIQFDKEFIVKSKDGNFAVIMLKIDV